MYNYIYTYREIIIVVGDMSKLMWVIPLFVRRPAARPSRPAQRSATTEKYDCAGGGESSPLAVSKDLVAAWNVDDV